MTTRWSRPGLGPRSSEPPVRNPTSKSARVASPWAMRSVSASGSMPTTARAASVIEHAVGRTEVT
jgi:hypothetical protein